MKSTKIVRTTGLAFAAAIFSLVCQAGPARAQGAAAALPQNPPLQTMPAQAVAAAQADFITPQGIENFGRVSPFLFRGAQPSREGFASLKKLGIDTVIDLRDERDEIAKEQSAVEGLGMRFLSIPWSGRHLPTEGQMVSFLQFIQGHPGLKIFVHCAQGRDRTGVMVAAYRMTLESWTPAKAVDEMHAFHYHQFMLPHLRAYVENFPKQLTADPNLGAVLLAAKAAAPAATNSH